MTHRMPSTYDEAVEMALNADNAIAGPGLGFVDGYQGAPFRETWARFEAYREAYRRGRAGAARVAKPVTLGPVERASLEGDPERPTRRCHCAGDDYIWDPTCERCRAAGCGSDVDGPCRLRRPADSLRAARAALLASPRWAAATKDLPPRSIERIGPVDLEACTADELDDIAVWAIGRDVAMPAHLVAYLMAVREATR